MSRVRGTWMLPTQVAAVIAAPAGSVVCERGWEVLAAAGRHGQELSELPGWADLDVVLVDGTVVSVCSGCFEQAVVPVGTVAQ